MKRNVSLLAVLLLGASLLLPAPTAAQGFGQQDKPPAVQIAPFVGYQFGGSVFSGLLDRTVSLESAMSWGGSIDFAMSQSWRLEVYYSRQDTQLETLFEPFDARVERLMVGIMEEKGEGNVKVFGSLLVGAARFVPGDGGLSSETYFSAGLGLGVKSFFTRNVGLRIEGHGFYTVVESGGGMFCTAGTCLFNFSGRGLWQGDVAAGLIIAF